MNTSTPESTSVKPGIQGNKAEVVKNQPAKPITAKKPEDMQTPPYLSKDNRTTGQQEKKL